MSLTHPVTGQPRGHHRRRLLAVASATALGVAGLVALAGPAHAVTVPTVVTAVPVDSRPFSVAVTPDGSRAYVTNIGSGDVVVVDTATNTRLATVPTGWFTTGVAISPDGTRVYATYQSSQTRTGQLAVISTATNTVIATVSTGAQATAVAVSPDGARVYVMASEDVLADVPDNGVVVVDSATNTVVGFYEDDNLGFDDSSDGGMAVSPDGAKLYVTDTGGGSVDVFNTATGTLIATIPDSGRPEGIALSTDGTAAYVTNRERTLSVISTATNTITATVGGLPNTPFGVAVTPDGTSVYVACFGGLAVIDPAGNTLVTTLGSVGGSGIAVNPAGTRAYATSSYANILMVLDVPTAVAPAVTSISPAFGDLSGGTSVTITGTGFTGATAVHFGAAAATTFTVDSSTQISATAPAATALGSVDVTVTTPSGTSATASADRYAYVNEVAKATAAGRLAVGGHDAQFGFDARATQAGGPIKGRLDYNDQTAGVSITAATITTFYLTSPTTAHAEGTATCTIAGHASSCPFTVTATDPGAFTLTYNTTTVGGAIAGGRVRVTPDYGGNGNSARPAAARLMRTRATATTPVVNATPATAAMTGGFSASLLGISLSGGRCATAALIYTNGTAAGDTRCLLLGVLGTNIDVNLHLAGGTLGTNAAAVTGTATITIAGLLPVTLPATEVLTATGTSGLRLTLGGVSLPILPNGTGNIEIG